jgi:hypothetical protein
MASRSLSSAKIPSTLETSLVRTEESLFLGWPTAYPLYIVVHEKPTVVVALQPVVQMNLIQIGTHEFFPQLMCLTADKGNL